MSSSNKSTNPNSRAPSPSPTVREPNENKDEHIALTHPYVVRNKSASPFDQIPSVKSTPRLGLKVITTVNDVSAPNSPPGDLCRSPISACSSASLLTPSTSTSSLGPPLFPEINVFKIPSHSRSLLPVPNSIRLPPPPFPYPLSARAILPDSATPPPSTPSPIPDPAYTFPPREDQVIPSLTRSNSLNNVSKSGTTRTNASHPYRRPSVSAEPPRVEESNKSVAAKRRKMWNHALEKSVFTPQELSTMSAPTRRTIYTATLEHHIEQLHEQLLALNLYPVPMSDLDQYRGLNCKTAKSMVAGLQKDFSDLQMKKLELQRTNQAMRACLMNHGINVNLAAHPALQTAAGRRHSVDSGSTHLVHYPNYFNTPK